jgi:hypothetical protein
MKKIILAALVTGTAMAGASPAFAQSSTGTLTLTGSVAPKCQIINGGGGVTTTSASTVALGELSQASGLLRTDSDLTAAVNGAGFALLSFRVVCTTATPGVSVDANPITAPAAAPTGYANRIDYAATATFSLVGPATQPVTNDSAAAAATTAVLSNRLTGTGTNVAITATNFRTPSATDVLVADSYSGSIVIVVSPT